jgi:hypothetical protein
MCQVGSILLGVSREDDKNIISHRVSIKFWPSKEQDEIEMSERKKNHLQYLQINWHISFKTKWFSHVIKHKNISSILKFWKLIHVIPTILKRSCLVLSYFEQDIKKCILSSISPELHCWHILDSGGVPLYIDPIQYGEKDSFLFHKQF